MGIQTDIIRASVHLTGGDELHGRGLQTYRHAGHVAHIATATVGGMHELCVYFTDPEQMRKVARWAWDMASRADEERKRVAAEERAEEHAMGAGVVGDA